LIEKKNGEKYTVNEIKNQLYDEYKKYISDEKIKNKIVDILIIEGKKTLGDQVHSGTLSFASFIYTDNYFLTTFDLWLLVNRFKIPSIFICQKFILQSKYKNHEFVGYGNLEDKFAFIIIPGFRAENIPNFKIIKSNKGDTFISLKEISEECIDTIQNSIRNKITIEEYLDGFVMPTKTVYEKKKPLLIEPDIEPKEIKEKNKKIILEETKPISLEKEVQQNKKPSRKVLVRGEPKNKSRRRPDIKKRNLLIVESDTEKV
jgi:hypothetical protein